jgi:hypothetical protein
MVPRFIGIWLPEYTVKSIMGDVIFFGGVSPLGDKRIG